MVYHIRWVSQACTHIERINIASQFRMVQQHLFINKLSQLVLGHLGMLPFELKARFAGGFIIGIMKTRKIRMLQCLFHRNALCWIEHQNFGKQIKHLRGRIREESLQWDGRLGRQGLHKPSGSFRMNMLHVLRVWSSNHVSNQVNLMHVILAREERFSAQNLGQNASHGPHIHSIRVLSPRQHNLWRAVPSGRDIGRQEPSLVVRVGHSREPKVANLQVTVAVEQNIRGLQIPVQHQGRMNKLECSK
mmetsp:Transcript_16789/g.29419  ORF Transcript_16789/g.29419 Transcript_16789/m.29419 type:complete len:247 (-) Transcript_16789:698-1438(-)